MRSPTLDTDLVAAALEYHRHPTPGKISVVPTKALINQRDLALAYSPGVAAACEAIVADPGEAADTDLARQPGRRRHQRHGGARPGQHRPARRQAGDGRQGLPVQEVRRHRRVRHRARRGRPGQARRHHRRARADARRREPRGHQGARVLLHRAEAARAHEDPGLPRRPARHRDHLRRRPAQRPQGRRQGHRPHQGRLLGRRRRGDRLPRPDGPARREARERLRLRQQGRDLRRPRAGPGAQQGPLRPGERARASWRTSSPVQTSSSAARPPAC